MVSDIPLPQRRSMRLPHYDYGQSGAYFVTICTLSRECLFGQIVGDEMRLSEAGALARREWLRSAEMRREIMLDEYIVMPNHLHGIVFIVETDSQRYDGKANDGLETAGIHRREPGVHRTPLRRPAQASLGAFINGYKASVTKGVTALRIVSGASAWQRNYYEHVIRNDDDLDRIRRYIADNPARWAEDRENPTLAGMPLRPSRRPPAS